MRRRMARPASSVARKRWHGELAVWIVPPLLLLWALLWLWPNLGHPGMFGWDEPAHQLATRGFHDTGLPVIYRAPLLAQPKAAWWNAHVFLHKPPLPFALGALMMWLVGVTPLALRLVSLASAVATAVGLFFFGRRVVGSVLAAILAAAFLCLPFGYLLVQGYQFGDVTDCSLLAFVTLSMWALAVAIERGSSRLAALAGALCGCAYLCKSVLALVPLGAVGALGLLSAAGLGPRVRMRLVFSFGVTAVAVALPWNLYSALRWPELYRWEAHHTLGFLSDTTRYWVRPFDGVFNEVNQLELGPWPVAIFPLAGLWLLWTAVRGRDANRWLLCLWLWGEWLPLSFVLVKVPAHAWAAAPAALLAVGLLIRDSFERPWLAGAGLGALGTGLALGLTPALSTVRGVVPGALVETATQGGLAEGLALALCGGALGVAIARLLPGRGARRLLACSAAGMALLVGVVGAPELLAGNRLRFRDLAVEASGDELGRALALTLPQNAVLFVSARDAPYSLGTHSLMFYSGLGAYPADEELIQWARLQGLHPYLASTVDQLFERVAAAPASARLQAFDLDAPRVVPAEPPAGMVLAHRQFGALELLGLAVARGDLDRDRYVFYVRSPADMERRLLAVSFTLDDGSVEHANLAPRGKLNQPPLRGNGASPEAGDVGRDDSLPGPPIEWTTDPKTNSWYTLALAGPPRSRLRKLELLGAELPLP